MNAFRPSLYGSYFQWNISIKDFIKHVSVNTLRLYDAMKILHKFGTKYTFRLCHEVSDSRRCWKEKKIAICSGKGQTSVKHCPYRGKYTHFNCILFRPAIHRYKMLTYALQEDKARKKFGLRLYMFAVLLQLGAMGLVSCIVELIGKQNYSKLWRRLLSKLEGRYFVCVTDK